MKSLSLQHSTEQMSRHDGRATDAKGSFSQTDYHYQATPRASAAGLSATQHSREVYKRELRSFREIANPIIGSGSRWQFAIEAAVLGLVGAIAAWSLVSLLIVLSQTARG